MREMMESVEMTPQDEQLLTPKDVRSPDFQRQQTILFRHFGLSCASPSDDKLGYQAVAANTEFDPLSNLDVFSGVAEVGATYTYGSLYVGLDELEGSSNGSGLDRKRAASVVEDDGETLGVKRQKLG